MQKMLHPKADVERLYIPRKDGGRGLIDVETAFKTATIGLDHYLKHKEGKYPKQVLEHERSKAKYSITKNATKFKREVTMPEFDNREDKSASENAVIVRDNNNITAHITWFHGGLQFCKGEIGRQHIEGASGCSFNPDVISPHPPRPMHPKTRPHVQHREPRPLLFTNSEWVL